MPNKQFTTVAELGKILGISRIAVFKKIKKGQIKAMKIGRSYAIPRKNITEILGRSLSEEQRVKIDEAVVRLFREHADTMRLLGRE